MLSYTSVLSDLMLTWSDIYLMMYILLIPSFQIFSFDSQHRTNKGLNLPEVCMFQCHKGST